MALNATVNSLGRSPGKYAQMQELLLGAKALAKQVARVEPDIFADTNRKECFACLVGRNSSLICSAVGVACSPKLDPVVVRVSTAVIGKETFDEQRQTEATEPGPDHRGPS